MKQRNQALRIGNLALITSMLLLSGCVISPQKTTNICPPLPTVPAQYMKPSGNTADLEQAMSYSHVSEVQPTPAQ